MLAIQIVPEDAANRSNWNEPLQEELLQLDERTERHDAGDGAGRFEPALVAHEDDFLPLHHYPRSNLDSLLPFARLHRQSRMKRLESRDLFGDRRSFRKQLAEPAVHDQIGIATDR